MKSLKQPCSEARLAIDAAKNTTFQKRQFLAACVYLAKVDRAKAVRKEVIRCLKENFTFWGMLTFIIWSIQHFSK